MSRQRSSSPPLLLLVAGGAMAETEVRPAAPGRARHRPEERDERRPRRRDRRREDRGRSPRRSTPPRPSRSSTSPASTSPPASSTCTSTSSRARARRARTPATTASTPTASRCASGVTTVVDAGCAGWRNFADFKDRVIDRSRTRVLAFLNIVGNGMRGGKYEQDLADMEAKPTAEMALQHKGLDRRDQDGALRGAGVGPGRARGRGGHDRRRAGPGRLRRQQGRAAARRARDEEAPPGRRLRPHVLGPAGRADARTAT